MMKIMNIAINDMGKIELTYIVKSKAKVGKMFENAKKCIFFGSLKKRINGKTSYLLCSFDAL
jgi:hypothetical protein